MAGQKITDLTPERRQALSLGLVAADTLVESLAVDMVWLLQTLLPAARQDDAGQLAAPLQGKPPGITRRMARAGAILAADWSPERAQQLAASPSDTVRGWLAYALCARPGLSLAQRLAECRPLADDRHFGVREWAWLALRPHLAAELPLALALLQPWTLDPSENIRRFASEITRPRGVWCGHLSPLRQDPRPGFALLDPLQADPSRYVQNSVANWLNDAAKDHPQLVQSLCVRWRQQNADSAATGYICRRALRSCGDGGAAAG